MVTRKINKVIVHCSATPDDRNVTVDDIRKWHLERGWKDIGYHYVIYRDGKIHTGRPVSEIGAHCEGHNADSIGICLIGEKKFTEAQFDSLRKLYSDLKQFYKLKIFGHRDFTDKKTCPNFEVSDYVGS